MTSEAHTHHFSSWAKERIDEMDATLTSIEGRLGALHADAKKQAEKVVSEIFVLSVRYFRRPFAKGSIKATPPGQRPRPICTRIGRPSKALFKDT